MKVILLGVLFIFCWKLNGQGDLNKPGKSIEIDLPDLKQKAGRRIIDLQQFLQIIANKKESDAIRANTIKKAMKFFSTDATIEVSSLYRNETTVYTAREYLYRLSKLDYYEVNISYGQYKIKETDEVTTTDYFITGIIFQTFEGKDSQGNTIYIDQTDKEVQILAELKVPNNKTWDFKFQKITVLDTRRVD